jgi:hypothetical protein
MNTFRKIRAGSLPHKAGAARFSRAVPRKQQTPNAGGLVLPWDVAGILLLQ